MTVRRARSMAIRLMIVAMLWSQASMFVVNAAYAAAVEDSAETTESADPTDPTTDPTSDPTTDPADTTVPETNGEPPVSSDTDSGHNGHEMNPPAAEEPLEPEELAANAQAVKNACLSEEPSRTFEIHAIEVDIVYNNYGGHDPNGKMYALGEDVQKIRDAVASNPGKPVKEVQPLVIRVNKGECIDVIFKNELSQKASIHIQGVHYDVQGSDGTAAGYNLDSNAAPAATINYRWYADREGTFLFQNGANMAAFSNPDGNNTMGQGLFGALIVEPAGASWTDPETGLPISSGQYADIHLPDQPDFREYALFFQDGIHHVQADGSPDLRDDGSEAGIYAVNYRAETLHDRMKYAQTPDGKDPTAFYSSWVHGDPSTPITRAYVGDPVRYRIIGANMEENHVFHLHGHRWKADSKASNTVDSETLNIGDATEGNLIGGAGYVADGKGAPGDYLWHCHLFPHYMEGMWGLFRVYDKQEMNLQPLPDREMPAQPNTEDPGFPHFIPGEMGKRPPKAPDPLLRPATALETTALDSLVPGAPNVNRCPADAPIIKYNVVGIETKITYNEAGDHDPEGRMYVLAEDESKIKNGLMRPRPLVIRANQGDCVEVTLENHLYNAKEPNGLSLHIHYVGYDPLGSDGTVVGWNYDQGLRPGEKIRYRWYADEEGNIFFHDHMSAGEKGFMGTFGVLIVEPQGSQWLDPKTGLPIKSGTEAMIVHPTKEDFREQVMIYHDFAVLYDKNGTRLPLESEPENFIKHHGYMGVNYSNAPFFRRSHADPAYVFSSWVHGDPQTPIIQAYSGDPIKVRLIQGAHEQQHNFTLHGLKWQREGTSGHDNHLEHTSTQTIGMSEQFTFALQPNPVGVSQRDYLWSSQAIEDLWSGMWGYVRIWGEQKSDLKALPDRETSRTFKRVNLLALQKMKKTNTAPPQAINSGNSCPVSATQKSYYVSAFTKDIPYNSHGDHDPYGIMFALKEDEDAIKNGSKPAEPLVIRANAGECIKVVLENNLPTNMPVNPDDPPLLMADRVPWPNSNRVSMHPQMLQYDVQGSDGATIGYNYDQTAGPGQRITYTWYADQEYGGTVLFDYGDIRSHRLHGAYGGLIIEPAGSQYRNPTTGESIQSGSRADIIVPDQADFREQVLLFTDGLYVVGQDGRPPIPEDIDPLTGEIGSDMEDRGEKGINYRAEPFSRRLANNPDPSLLFSSHAHGDPATPLAEAYVGDPTRFRVMHAADRSRGSVFSLHGHRWPYQWTDQWSKTVSSQGSITVGESLDLMLEGGASGRMERAGDYLYREMKLRRYLEGGMWGIFRVHDKPQAHLLSLPDRIPDAPTGVNSSIAEDETGSVQMLTWEPSVSAAVYGYNVYEMSGVDQFNKINARLITDPYYRFDGTNSIGDGNSSDVEARYYVVTAVDRYGNASPFSGSVEMPPIKLETPEPEPEPSPEPSEEPSPDPDTPPTTDPNTEAPPEPEPTPPPDPDITAPDPETTAPPDPDSDSATGTDPATESTEATDSTPEATVAVASINAKSREVNRTRLRLLLPQRKLSRKK